MIWQLARLRILSASWSQIDLITLLITKSDILSNIVFFPAGHNRNFKSIHRDFFRVQGMLKGEWN